MARITLAMGTALVAALCALPSVAFSACGDRGGPGYRGPDGKCVGWSALARVCGDPPTLRCTAERGQPEANAAANYGSQIRTLMDNAHQRAKQRKGD